ncbi:MULTISPECIES: hypothetical protein [Muribaculaceae]|jgi:hypothetical protein|uniref:hypothetical protein n=1 Tax=Muribaculaceae TaxID=2005473 RepID=UPI0025AE1615|nr:MULTISPECIES: hypothetical protein [Muribaculaceae]
MEYYGNRLCISMRDLVDGGIMSEPNYKQLASRGRFDVVRRGGGAAGCYALVAVDSLPQRYQDKVNEVYPGGAQARLEGWIKSNYEVDQAATAFFFDKGKCGVALTADKAKEYITNASVLNTCIKLYERASTAQRLFGGKYDWSMMATTIETLRKHFGHTLPASTLRFRKKVNDYKANGYVCLISGKFGNQSARKVDHKTERLILGIAVLPNKPWNTNVLELYNSFVTGELDVYDPETGELFDPEQFTDKNGEPMVLSEATINNYLNKPKNRVLIEHRLSSYTTFMHEQMPHMHRHHGEFSLSKVSFDDRDLPRKLKDSRIRPKAYYAYDVTSGCCIGSAYNRAKNVDLVVDMFRDMFRLLDRQGWGCPAEVEVENHLMSQWRDSFLRAGVMFPFVRFCAPMNSQEKHAEQFNGAKKRSIEHRNHIGIGRFYAKSRQYRTESVKVFDELNDTYVEKEYYTWDELIADDLRDIYEYNHALHPNQKKYKGMTRWDVLVANINPTLQPLDKATIARYVGERVSTTIRRNSYCRVAGEDWWLSKTEAIELLAPNDYKVEAYYLTDAEGKITDMFIYQGDMYIDRLDNVGTFCTARAEQTEKDEQVFVEQRKKISHFNKYIEDHAIARVGLSERDSAAETVEPEEVPVPVEEPRETQDMGFTDDYAARALADL